MDVESTIYFLKQCKQAELLIWRVIFDLQILISELVHNLDNTLYQLYATKGKLDCCIDELSVQQSTSELPGNLFGAKEKLDSCTRECNNQQDYYKLLVKAKEELDCCVQRVQIVAAANYFRERNRKQKQSPKTLERLCVEWFSERSHRSFFIGDLCENYQWSTLRRLPQFHRSIHRWTRSGEDSNGKFDFDRDFTRVL